MKRLLLCLLFLLLLTSCGKKSDLPQVVESATEVPSSYETIYIGKPIMTDFTLTENSFLISSDTSIAEVNGNLLLGKQEGYVEISLMEDNQKKSTINYYVTTFNNGRQAEACYEIGPGGFTNSTIEYRGHLDPSLLQAKINTIQDSICYFQESGFRYEDYAPIVMTEQSCWIWSTSGDAVLQNKFGQYSDIANAAAYLLQDDFEDMGFIMSYGTYSSVYNWFYEDGYYYLVNYNDVLTDLINGVRTNIYTPYKTASLEDLTTYVTDMMDLEQKLAVIMVSTADTINQPPVYMSFIWNSFELPHVHSVIGYEDVVLKNAKILFQSNHFDFEIKSFPSDEMPIGVPRHDAASVTWYEYTNQN